MEGVFTLFYYLASFVVVLSVIVFVHEFGHFIVARLCGVKVEVFSIGFGKKLLSWQDKHGTDWQIAAIPAGGYVKMFGDSNAASVPDEEKVENMSEEEKKLAFQTKPLFSKALIVAAGPVANFVFAIVVLAGMYMHYGKAYTLSEISEVVEGGAAYEAGIKPGDVIMEIDEKPIESFSDITRAISTNLGEEIVVTLRRADETLFFKIKPKMMEKETFVGETVKTPMLGIVSSKVSLIELSFFEAVKESVSENYFLCKATLKGVWQILTGQRSADQISGPISIAKYSGKTMELGLQTVLWFMVVISVNLGLINLFPIPLLDGGHLLYYALEAIKGEPLSDKIQNLGFKIGMLIIVALALFATTNDIIKLGIF